MFFSTKFFCPKGPPFGFFPKFLKFFQNFKKLWKLPYFGLCKVFKAFFNFFFFLKIFPNFGHRGGGVRPNVEFSTFFFFWRVPLVSIYKKIKSKNVFCSAHIILIEHSEHERGELARVSVWEELRVDFDEASLRE